MLLQSEKASLAPKGTPSRSYKVLSMAIAFLSVFQCTEAELQRKTFNEISKM